MLLAVLRTGLVFNPTRPEIMVETFPRMDPMGDKPMDTHASLLQAASRASTRGSLAYEHSNAGEWRLESRIEMQFTGVRTPGGWLAFVV